MFRRITFICRYNAVRPTYALHQYNYNTLSIDAIYKRMYFMRIMCYVWNSFMTVLQIKHIYITKMSIDTWQENQIISISKVFIFFFSSSGCKYFIIHFTNDIEH